MSKNPPYKKPVPKLVDSSLYIGDNGRTLHGKEWGVSARFTGRDLSGQKVLYISKDDADALGITCENCDREERTHA